MGATARWVGMTQQALDPERRFSQRSRMDDWEHYLAQGAAADSESS